MEAKPNDSRADNLPPNATEFIRQVVRAMGYHKKARQDVEAELTAHFEDELRGCAAPQEREQKVRRAMEGFGNAKLLAVLCRRAKRRCRPLWATALVRTAQGSGMLLISFALYMLWFFTGRPAPTVDYVALLNQIGRPRIVERDNAWPDYEKAAALLVEPDDELRQMDAFTKRNRPDYPGLAALPEEARQAITQWVQKNEAAWREFVTASGRPYCLRPYVCADAKEPWMLNVLLPHVAEFRTLAALGIWRARVELERGQLQPALSGCLAVARAGAHWQPRGTLIEQLVGLALSRLAHEEILAIVHERTLPPAELADLQRKVADLYPARYPLIDLEGERLSLLDTIQHVFTDGGPGGGHLAPSAARMLAVMEGNEEFLGEAKGPLLMGLSLIHAGRDATTAKVKWIFDQQAKCAQLSPCERYAAGGLGADRILNSLPKYRYALVHLLAPALDRAADLAFQGKTLHEATLTVLALQRYRADKGRYPGSLDELKQASYLDALPADPYSEGPLAYKVSGDKFLLYSVGPDFKDNGGQAGTDRKGRLQRWPSSGDTVFWPVP